MQIETFLVFLLTTAVVVFSPGAAAVAVASQARPMVESEHSQVFLELPLPMSSILFCPLPELLR